MIKKSIICAGLILLLSACNFALPTIGQSPVTPTLALLATSETAKTTPQVPNSGFKISELMQSELVDVNSGEHYKLSDFGGKVVLIEGIATWCPTCFKEAQTLKTLQTKYDQNSGFIVVSLGLDSHEDEATLKDYAQQFGFNWKYSIAPLAVAHYIGNEFGALFLDPTLVPMLIIDRQGNLHPLKLGYKSEVDLQAALDPYIKSETN